MMELRGVAILKGVGGAAGLLALYFGVTSAISGWGFATAQFAARWYWLAGLSIGFGTQVGLVSYLRALHTARVSAAMATVSGTTSGGAMLACCAHYLVNLLPLVGIGGIAAVIGQYQTELFVVGAAANVMGLGYLIRKLVSAGGYGSTRTT